ncbi:MAG TPA: alpha/beta fold hydrolase [Actinocrinis sp.]
MSGPDQMPADDVAQQSPDDAGPGPDAPSGRAEADPDLGRTDAGDAREAGEAGTTEGGTRRRTVVSSGIRLAVFEDGDPADQTVLLVHGYPDTHRIWDRVAADLAADHRVVRYDVRGAGGSDAPADLRGYRLDRLADDLFAVIEAVSADRPVHLAAHDWGSIQAWHAATDPRAAGRIASYTSISGPCLDHVGRWSRRRLAKPTPRNLGQLLNQQRKSWYIAAFHVPLLAPAAWRLGLARNWGALLHRLEGVTPGPDHPQPTLADDAVRGLNLYRANMLRHVLRPASRPTRVPVQLITLTRDRFVSPALSDDLDEWVPRLWRRSIPAAHWSALTDQSAATARVIRQFAAHISGAAPGTDTSEADAELDRARSVPRVSAVPGDQRD